MYYSSSLGSVSSLLGPHGDDGSILMCRGQKLGIKQGIPLLLAFFFFSVLDGLFKLVLEVSLIFLFLQLNSAYHRVTWRSSQSDCLVCHYKAFAQDAPSLGVPFTPPPYLAQPAIAPPRSLSDKH